MPFRSESQKKWMYANKPTMARKWQQETPKGTDLPLYASKNKKIKKK
tara:strand:- start:227 stop:367 length:141 start_codon:yes stop_codon:yes gene_type:complete